MNVIDYAQKHGNHALQGCRLKTSRGPGVFNYMRLAPPSYTAPEVVSVKLDSGSSAVFKAEDVNVEG